MLNAASARNELKRFASPQKAKILQSFFKTGPGQYAEGDVFIGVTVPNTRKVAKQFKDLPKGEILKLLTSPVHEERLLALLILAQAFEKASLKGRADILNLYLDNIRYINNWDLVDLSAPKILGAHLADKRDRAVLNTLCCSENLWARRIAIVCTYAFIKKGDFAWTLKIADKLMGDKEDLIHKAIGWMLREVGKRDLKVLVDFLAPCHSRMPRTMLRYAVERFPESDRKNYLLTRRNKPAK